MVCTSVSINPISKPYPVYNTLHCDNIVICYLLRFCVCKLYFYTCLPHWYVCIYAVGLVECVSLTAMGIMCACSCFYIFTGDKFRVISGIWCCMCRCMCHSYVCYPYWSYKCNIFLKHFKVCPCFLFLWNPWYPLWLRIVAWRLGAVV
jgi:hypothetical protein